MDAKHALIVLRKFILPQEQSVILGVSCQKIWLADQMSFGFVALMWRRKGVLYFSVQGSVVGL
jgi:hypothetical protein